MSEKNFLVQQHTKDMKEREELTIQTKEDSCKNITEDGK
jgi:hypothetical protein